MFVSEEVPSTMIQYDDQCEESQKKNQMFTKVQPKLADTLTVDHLVVHNIKVEDRKAKFLLIHSEVYDHHHPVFYVLPSRLQIPKPL